MLITYAAHLQKNPQVGVGGTGSGVINFTFRLFRKFCMINSLQIAVITKFK